ncbi:MAG: enolase C-terminal domain-like protein [Acidimicrobiia bacterium]|nr:enolase C-terminal domain-like protein [Acidimicrobiia bacterium]
METAPIEQIRAWLIDLPMVRPFASARSTLGNRRIVVVCTEGGGVSGWGEAAPVPGHTIEDADGIWTSLETLLRIHGSGAPAHVAGLLAAAFAQAADDASAKLSNQPLWRILDGAPQVVAGAAIGVDESGRPDTADIGAAALAGYRQMKLKITPACAAEDLRRVLDEHPEVSFGADANGSFTRSDRAALEAIDSVGLAYLEQPGSPLDLAFHRETRRHLQTPIALDESVADSDDIIRVLAADAADVINLKTGGLGASRALQLAQSITSEGVGVRLGGLIESGVGRAHAIALAGNPVFAWPGDIAASDRYFADDLVKPQWRASDGMLSIPDEPGIGVTIDRRALDAHSVASLSTVESG